LALPRRQFRRPFKLDPNGNGDLNGNGLLCPARPTSDRIGDDTELARLPLLGIMGFNIKLSEVAEDHAAFGAGRLLDTQSSDHLSVESAPVGEGILLKPD